MLDFDYNPKKKFWTCIFKGRLDTILSTQISAELESKYISLSENEDSSALLDFGLVFDLKEVNFYFFIVYQALCCREKNEAERAVFVF